MNKENESIVAESAVKPNLWDRFGVPVMGFLFALLLSVFTVLVIYVRKGEPMHVHPASNMLLVALQVLIFFAAFVVGWKVLDKIDKAASDDSASHFLFSWNPKSVIVTTLLLFALFIPYMVLFYPGVSSLDTTNQIKDFVTGTMPIEISWNPDEPMISCFLNDHHPVFDTFIFVFFTEYIGSFVGATQGAFIYTCIQSFLTALFMSLMLCSMEKFHIPYGYRKTGFLFLGLAPFVVLYVIGMLKDSLHCMFYIPYFLLYILIVREGASRRKMVLLVILSLLLALTKKTGTYFVILCNLALILLPSVRKRLAGWAASFILPALLTMIIMPYVLFPMFNIFPGGKQEALGFTLQMTAVTYREHKAELSPDEIAVIGDVINLDKLDEEFARSNYDSVKHLFNFEATDQQLSDYKKLWLSLLIRYPKSAVKAILGTAGGFFSPTERIRVYFSFAKNKYTNVISPENLQPYRDAFSTAYLWFVELHGLGIFFQCVLYMWWLPLAAILRVLLMPCFRGCRFKEMLCMFPTIVSILVLLVSPYSMGRYGLPLLYTLPMIMGLSSRKAAFIPQENSAGSAIADNSAVENNAGNAIADSGAVESSPESSNTIDNSSVESSDVAESGAPETADGNSNADDGAVAGTADAENPVRENADGTAASDTK